MNTAHKDDPGKQGGVKADAPDLKPPPPAEDPPRTVLPGEHKPAGFNGTSKPQFLE